MRDGVRRTRAALRLAVATGAGAALCSLVISAAQPDAVAATAARAPRPGTATAAAVEQRYAAVLNSIGLPALGAPSDAVARATAAIEQAGETEATAAQQAGIFLPGQKVPTGVAVPAASVIDSAASPVRPLGKLHPADLLVVAPSALPAAVARRASASCPA